MSVISKRITGMFSAAVLTAAFSSLGNANIYEEGNSLRVPNPDIGQLYDHEGVQPAESEDACSQEDVDCILIAKEELERLQSLAEGDEGKKPEYNMTMEELLEEKGGWREAYVFHEFYQRRIVKLNGPVDDTRGAYVAAKIRFLNLVDDENGIELEDRKPITIWIDSTGGSVLGGLAVLSAMRDSKVPIHTHCDTHALSFGQLISVMGDHRTATPSCIVMTHEISGGIGGQLENMEVGVTNAIAMDEEFNRMVAERTGHTLEYIRQLNAYDMELRGQQLLDMNFIDEIVGRDFVKHDPNNPPVELHPEEIQRRVHFDKNGLPEDVSAEEIIEAMSPEQAAAMRILMGIDNATKPAKGDESGWSCAVFGKDGLEPCADYGL